MEIITFDHQVFRDLSNKIDKIAEYVFKKETIPAQELDIWLTSEELADLLKISTRTLQRMRKDRTIAYSMETAGKEIENEELRHSLSACGIGTPATRASIIETLFQREYMIRQKKSLVPTEKGLALYSVVKDMNIANVEMTGEWELALANIENGKLHG